VVADRQTHKPTPVKTYSLAFAGRIKLSKTTTRTVCYLVSNVLGKATALPLWSAMDSHWNKNIVSLVPSVTV